MLSGVVALLGMGGWFAYQRWLNPVSVTVAARLISVERGVVELTISESGTVTLADEQTLKSPEDATVERVFVQEGDRVKRGALLIALRNRSEQQRQQDQMIENQKATLELARKGEIVREQQARLSIAQQRFKESQNLLSQGIIAKTKVQDDLDRVSSAQSEVRNAEVEQRKAQLEVQKGEATLQDIQQRLEDNRLTSPMDALILRVDVKPGDGAKRETTLLTLGDLRSCTILSKGCQRSQNLKERA
ncbi:HlyD family secretion protein [Pantanalinema sp. GBBB05]|uniref:HlyD family secretion protein n=1 Tax=Pantanalinema sp. GBBB05 TaxID=2604139 RepID=UPI003D81A07B